jgi:hypothetical protein
VIPLVHGWNMIGTPFLSSTAISSLKFAGGSKTFSQASKLSPPLVGSTVLGYLSSTNQYVSASSMIAGQCYWIYAYANTDLDVPHP